ncbi:hypothetical protein [Streptomyces sp. NPDC048392]|uniref:hypothetical protein n=1 Tax=Streptomyces sp. NPDC048392 TaxID=3365543 RepID=UPI0037216B0F
MRVLRPDRELPGQLCRRRGALDSGAGRADGWAPETVDPGIDYAYTKIANNLNGRVSRTRLTCDGHVWAQTGWC